MLSLILIAYLMAGLDSGWFVLLINSVLWLGLLLTTLWSPGVPERLRRVGGAATLVALAMSVSLGFFPDDVAQGTRQLLLALAQIAAMLAILSRITRHRVVTLQTVMGGVAAFALIAFIMAAVLHGCDLLTPGPFLHGVKSPGDYTYFSFITLTTVGYGDITPATDLAKRLVAVEAFVGQVFLITLVARLVSLWGRPE